MSLIRRLVRAAMDRMLGPQCGICGSRELRPFERWSHRCRSRWHQCMSCGTELALRPHLKGSIVMTGAFIVLYLQLGKVCADSAPNEQGRLSKQDIDIAVVISACIWPALAIYLLLPNRKT